MRVVTAPGEIGENYPELYGVCGFNRADTIKGFLAH